MAAGCGAGEPEFDVRGVHVMVNTTAPFAAAKDFPRRVEKTIDAALQFWDANWNDISGMTIILDDDQYVSCACSTRGALGCSEPGLIRITTRDPSLGTWHCVEQSVLVHEVGHAVRNDRDHDDPRWMDFVPVLERLDGGIGYDEQGFGRCPLYLSVWRHVLHRP